MKVQCPSCHTEYEVDNSYLDKEVECAKCSETFIVSMSTLVVESPANALLIEKRQASKPSSLGSGENAPKQTQAKSTVSERNIGKSNPKGKLKLLITGIVIFLAAILVLAATGLFKSSKNKAIENCMTMYEVEASDFIILDNKTVKKAWMERARLQYELAEKNGFGEEFIKLWNDRKIIGFIKMTVEFSKEKDKNTSDEKKAMEAKKAMEETTKYLEVNYPKFKKIFELYDLIEKEYKSVHQLMIGFGCMRSKILLAQEEKYKNTDYADLKQKAIKFFSDVLFTSWNKRSEIEYPSAAHSLCVTEATQLINKIEADNKNLAKDWMLFILSPDFENEVKKNLANNGETCFALYWLKRAEEKVLPKLPYGTSMSDFLEIKHDRWHFYGRYMDTCDYGKIKD